MSAYPTSLFLILHCSLRDIGAPSLGKATAAVRTAVPIPIGVCSRIFVYMSKQWYLGGFLTRVQMMHTIEHGSCTNTPKESLRWKLTLLRRGTTGAVSSMSDPKFSQLSYMPDPMSHEGLTKSEQSTKWATYLIQRTMKVWPNLNKHSSFYCMKVPWKLTP